MLQTDVEINYDQNGAEKSVVVPYSLYLEMLVAKTGYDDLKNKLNQMYFILSDALPQSAPAESVEIDVDETLDVNSNARETEPEEHIEQRDIRYYQQARGYYLPDKKRFCILAGSKARCHVSYTFESKCSGLLALRKNLISSKILTQENSWNDYVFTRDYIFSSSSAAACLVDGNSRSGPESFGRVR